MTVARMLLMLLSMPLLSMVSISFAMSVLIESLCSDLVEGLSLLVDVGLGIWALTRISVAAILSDRAMAGFLKCLRVVLIK